MNNLRAGGSTLLDGNSSRESGSCEGEENGDGSELHSERWKKGD